MLILCVGVIVLMVALSSGFLLAVSPQRGAGYTQAVERLARMAAYSGRDHAIAALLQDHADHDATTLRGRWREDFVAVAADGQPVRTWEAKLSVPREAVRDDQVNVQPDDRLLSLLLEFGPHAEPGYAGGSFHDIVGSADGGTSSTSSRHYPVARWHELDHLDLGLRATAPADSAFTVRYAVEILDADGHLRANPDYPDYQNLPWQSDHDPARPAFPVAPDPADPDAVGYLRYHAYLQRYARSAASMYGTREARAPNMHPYAHGTDGFDRERVELLSDGSVARNRQSHLGGANWYHQYGHRQSFAQLLRGERYRWSLYGGSGANSLAEFSHAGRVFSYGTAVAAFDGSGTHPLGYTDRLHAALLSPYGRGLRDQGWEPGDPSSPLNGDAADNPNVPWRVNLLTASAMVRERMLQGLSAHLRFEERLNGGRSSTAQLLGVGYPEAFPLALDDGRCVSVVGADGVNGDERIGYGFRLGDTNGPDGRIFSASRNSYWWDAVATLARTIDHAQLTWNRGWDLRDATVPGGVHDSRCRLDPAERDPAAIAAQVEAEWLRLLGEDSFAPQAGLLATQRRGGRVAVGYGEGAWAQARVEPEANTRAMEYLLNDLRMSLLGTAAENFNGDDANRDGAITRDDAESTCAGWWLDGERCWSYWYPGIHEVADPANAWLTRRGWYRLWYGESRATPAYRPGRANRLARWDGERWVEYVAGDHEFDTFLAINAPFLRDPGGAPWSATNRPIKPWSATGRLFVGRSRLWRIVARGQVLDAVTRSVAGQVDLETTFAIVPDPATGSVADSRIAYQRVHLHVDPD